MNYDYNGGNDTRRATDSLKRQRAIAQMKRERRKKLLIRRTIIVVVGLLIVFLAIFLLVQLFRAIFGGSGGNKTVETTAVVAEAASETPTQAAADTATNFITPNIKDDGKEGYYSASNGGIYIYNNMALELFSGSDDSAQAYADTISKFKTNAPEFTVYNMVVPNHTEFAIPPRLIQSGAVSTTSQADNIKAIYSKYSADVKPINAYNNLAKHLDEYIYFNTDHHWTGLGAYYAYQAFCEQTGQTPLDLSTCTEHTIEGFEGSMVDSDPSLYEHLDTVHFWTFPYQTHAMRQDNPGEELYETSVLYEQESGGSIAYGVFIYGDAPLFVEYNDELKNGKKIAVVKESYGNAFVPFLTNNYEEVHVIDFRHFGQNLKSYMQDNGITEVLFLNNTVAANAAVQLDRIESIY